MLKRGLRVVGWLLLGAVLLLAITVGALLFLNRHDQPPSAQLQALHAAAKARPTVADADNAYIYLLGMGVAQGEDPTAAGRARLEWMTSQPPGTPLGPKPYDESSWRDQRSEAVKALFEICRNPDAECSRALMHGDAELAVWLESEGWLLERYLALITHTQWRESIPRRGEGFLPYQHATDGQRLLMARAWQLGGQGEAHALTELLQRDLVFWRRALAHSDLLLTKMIASTALRRHFGWGSLAIQRLPSAAAMAAIPSAWSTALTPEERSMRRSLAGEVLWMEWQVDDAFQLWQSEDHSISDSLLQWMAKSLFRRQDTLNRHAILMMQQAEVLDGPVHELVSAAARQRTVAETESWPALPEAPWYNLAGKMALAISEPAYSDYGLRIADLEGMRRLALLSVELHGHRANASALPGLLKTSAWQDPYTGKPFTWDSASGELVFEGLEPGERSRYVIPYQPGG